MAQEKPRATRATTTKTTKTAKAADDHEKDAPATPRSRTKTAAKATPAKQAATRRVTPRRKAATTPEPERVAELAYLLWERGEPGDPTEHWLRAEAELRAA